MKISKAMAMILPIVMGLAACGNGGEEDSFAPTENVKVSDTASIAAIPEDAEKEIVFLGEYDLNPTEGNAEKSTELQLFESKGGSIKQKPTTNENRFNDLASLVMANKDVPDIFKYEWLAFPSQAIKQMYQPIDSIVDFSSPLWESAADTAEQFMLGDEHYVAPLGYSASAMLCYDRDTIAAEGLSDPYELYKNGEWTWSAWEEIMSEYAAGGSEDSSRCGVNGFFRTHIIQQTGKKMVDYRSQKYVSNLDDPDIEKAQDFLTGLCREGLILEGWYGTAQECFAAGCLFYAMGDWAYSGANGPAEGDNWGIVPIPAYDDNPQAITTSDMTAYMWVNGSKRAEAVKCWFECCRAAFTDPQYAQTNKDKFMENNPYWTEEMYEVKLDAVSEDRLMIFDYAFGISSALGDKNSFDGANSLIDTLYNTPSTASGEQYSWTQLREMYSPVVESEVENVNAMIDEINAEAAAEE